MPHSHFLDFPLRSDDNAMRDKMLAYMALTRGRQRVTVSYCAFPRGFTKPSMFIEDLPAENVVHRWLHMPQASSNAPDDTARHQTRWSHR